MFSRNDVQLRLSLCMKYKVSKRCPNPVSNLKGLWVEDKTKKGTGRDQRGEEMVKDDPRKRISKRVLNSRVLDDDP